MPRLMPALPAAMNIMAKITANILLQKNERMNE